MREFTWDLFISHASEDKDFVRPLEEKLSAAGFKVWYDENILTLGDSLVRKINEGLSKSKFGLVVLSPNFFAKGWPQSELDGLFSFEANGEKKILPIWHNITAYEIRDFSPLLAGKLAVNSNRGFDTVVNEICKVLQPAQKKSKIAFEFTDEFNADPVSVAHNLQKLNSDASHVDIDWPTALNTLLNLLPTVKKDILDYKSGNNFYSNLDPAEVKTAFDHLNATEHSVFKTKAGVEQRLNFLIRDFDQAWDYDKQKCIVNFLGFSSINIIYSLLYAIPITYCESKVSNSFLEKVKETKASLHINKLFHFKEEPFSARFKSVANLVFGSYEYFKANKWDLLEAKAIYPCDIHPFFYYSVLIPQVEFHLAMQNSDFRLNYTPPKAEITLINDDKGNEYLCTYNELTWLSNIRKLKGLE